MTFCVLIWRIVCRLTTTQIIGSSLSKNDETTMTALLEMRVLRNYPTQGPGLSFLLSLAPTSECFLKGIIPSFGTITNQVWIFQCCGGVGETTAVKTASRMDNLFGNTFAKRNSVALGKQSMAWLCITPYVVLYMRQTVGWLGTPTIESLRKKRAR